jgi:glycosyltransferase involved in cell wall biosynthesis
VPEADPRTPDVWVILPTYNEAENLERIVGDVLEHLPESRRVLIVDDATRLTGLERSPTG